jgi:cell division protein FtsI/penicillin-binding protein 2
MAIGQGYVQVTPLQMANVVAAIANGGTLYRPTLVDRIGAGGTAPEETPVGGHRHAAAGPGADWTCCAARCGT